MSSRPNGKSLSCPHFVLETHSKLGSILPREKTLCAIHGKRSPARCTWVADLAHRPNRCRVTRRTCFIPAKAMDASGDEKDRPEASNVEAKRQQAGGNATLNCTHFLVIFGKILHATRNDRIKPTQHRNTCLTYCRDKTSKRSSARNRHQLGRRLRDHRGDEKGRRESSELQRFRTATD